MHLSKTEYYADFAIDATVLASVTTFTVCRNGPYETSIWLAMVATGAALWTLIEYVLHRFVLHRMPYFAAMHDVHHQSPVAYVGTPTWLSKGVIVGAIFLPAWGLSSLNEASGLAIGVMAGFFWYGVVHHAIHFRKPRLLARNLILASRRHALHHYSGQPGNFGVTTSLWDHVFGTALEVAADRTVSAD